MLDIAAPGIGAVGVQTGQIFFFLGGGDLFGLVRFGLVYARACFSFNLGGIFCIHTHNPPGSR
jgi:hypothetical protein